MKVAILYYNFFNATGTDRKIGGIETYLWNLAKLISERGDEPILFQPADSGFKKEIDHLTIIGVPRNKKRLLKNGRKDLYEYARAHIDMHKDLIIFGADHASVATKCPRSISIQHGISWDLPGSFLRSGWFAKFPFIPDAICKKYVIYRCLKYFENCPNRVCVDYNFLNWYRTQTTDHSERKIWVIPNFVDCGSSYNPTLDKHFEKKKKIIFARRFVEHRGTRLMVEVAQKLLKNYNNIEICFAGEGPDKEYIAEKLGKEPRASIMTYDPTESLSIHKSFQIAVIPSLASEGTPLSLAEAMAAGCAVVATNVGGMTNMILDGYNGCLINPRADELYDVLNELINNNAMCLKLGKRAMETAREAFSLLRWKNSWEKVLNEVQHA